MKKEEAVKIWLKRSNDDLKLAREIFELKHYNYCLFFCHLSLERILKALIVKKSGKSAPPIHDLARLAKHARIGMDDKLSGELAEITTFNVEARYDTIKLAFYKKATKKYTTEWLWRTEQIHKWLKDIF